MPCGAGRGLSRWQAYKNFILPGLRSPLAEIPVIVLVVAALLARAIPTAAATSSMDPGTLATGCSLEAPEGGGAAPRAGAAASTKSTVEPAPPVSRFSLALLGSYRKSMEIEKDIQRACGVYGVPPVLARAVCMYESGANDNLTSGAGAHGYFQVMPATFRLMKVGTNIEAGVKYLSQLLRDYGREDDALAAYNGGPGRLKRGRALPIETLQYVVGVGTYRTLLTREEDAIRADASLLELHTVGAGEDWASISALTGVPVLELRMYNSYLALRPLRPGHRIAYPARSGPPILLPHRPGESGPTYVTRRGDNYLMLAFAFGVDLERFRADNALWRVQVPFEGMRLVVSERQDPKEDPDSADPAPVSAGSAAPAPAAPAAAPAPATDASHSAAALAPPAPLVHKVKRGETLNGIATRYDVSTESIRAANKLSRQARIVAGQILKIPIEAPR